MFEGGKAAQPKAVVDAGQKIRRSKPELHRNVLPGRVGREQRQHRRPFRRSFQGLMPLRTAQVVNGYQGFVESIRKMFGMRQQAGQGLKIIVVADGRRQRKGVMEALEEAGQQLAANAFENSGFVQVFKLDGIHGRNDAKVTWTKAVQVKNKFEKLIHRLFTKRAR